MAGIKTCAVYARVSTDQQGESLENQVAYAREYIRRLGSEYQLDEDCIYTDFDQSGYYTRFVQRPAIQRALADAQTGRYQVMVFKEISRISRDQAEHIEIVSRFTQCGVRVIAINDHLDSDRPETLDWLGLHSVLSEMESKRISSRVSSGKKALARRGVWSGEAPIGYLVDPVTRRLAVDPALADIPRLIFRLFTQSGYGTLRIAQYLNERGLLTKQGRLWSRVTVSRVLKNPVYIGDLVYGKTRNTLKRRFDEHGYTKVQGRQALPPEEWVVLHNAHPPLVDPETFARAQTLLAVRAPARTRRARQPLTGVLRCGRCGTGMIGQVQRRGEKEYRYYTCARAFRFGRAHCDQPNLQAERLERAVWQHITAVLARYQTAQVQLSWSTPDDPLPQRIQRLERELAKTQIGLQRLLTDDELDATTRAQLQQSLLSRWHNLEDELNALRRQPGIGEGSGLPQVRMAEWLPAWTAHMLSFEPAGRDRLRQVLQALLHEVVADGYTVRQVVWNYHPDGDCAWPVAE
ncbi:MAG: recombinase family protein [Alicyclobacillus sp.]|nr:recombinase family protein [Alicyclobacillus sp.]